MPGVRRYVQGGRLRSSETERDEGSHPFLRKVCVRFLIVASIINNYSYNYRLMRWLMYDANQALRFLVRFKELSIGRVDELSVKIQWRYRFPK